MSITAQSAPLPSEPVAADAGAALESFLGYMLTGTGMLASAAAALLVADDNIAAGVEVVELVALS